jgi:hypothetical protein
MKRIRQLAVTLALASLVVAGLLVSPAAATTTGFWYFHGPQTFTQETTTTTGTDYQTAVRPPINSDGTSNWPAKRGVIPVQFDLLAAPTTTTTTTKTYDPPVWKSLQADGSVRRSRAGNGPAADCFLSGVYGIGYTPWVEPVYDVEAFCSDSRSVFQRSTG